MFFATPNAAKMHASLLIGVLLLLLFYRHIPAAAAPSNNNFHNNNNNNNNNNNRGLDYVGSWHPGKHPAVEVTKDGIIDVDIRNTTASPPKEKDKRGDSGDYEDCRDLSQGKYIFRRTMIDAVEEFCREDAHDRAQDKTTRGISRTFYSGNLNEVIISLFPSLLDSI